MKKKSQYIYFIMAVCSSLISSCAKDDDPDLTNQKQYGGEVTASVNGTNIVLSKNNITVASGNFEMTSAFDNKTMFSFSIHSGIGATVYGVSNDSNDAKIFYDPNDGQDSYGAKTVDNTGSIVIISIDETKKTMSGTFTAKLQRGSANDKVSITDGTFTNVPYNVQNGGEGNSYMMKANGTEIKMKSSFVGSGGTLLSAGFVSQTKYIQLFFPIDIQPGTYDVAQMADLPRIIYTDGLYSYKPLSGNIVITSNNTSAKQFVGTFNVKAESYPVNDKTVSLTDGVFNLSY